MQLMNEMVNKKATQNVKLHADNQGVIALAKDPIRKERHKHIDIKYHFIKSEIEMGTITLNYIPTEDNVADIFTKSTSKSNLHMPLKLIGQWLLEQYEQWTIFYFLKMDRNACLSGSVKM